MRKLLALLALGVLFMIPATSTSADCGVCGDLTGDGQVNISDVVAYVDWIYTWPNPITPTCPSGGDVNCDNGATSTDLDIIVDWMFNGGPAPCDPVAFPACN